VVITPAHGSDLVPLLALGYRLTQREQQVLRFLARGMTTGEITDRLGISSHTVRDHIKALFGKVGVRSRAELVARIFAEHYFDRLEANIDETTYPAGLDNRRLHE
jgi:DNA-binding NarL/FixJ family response regulator